MSQHNSNSEELKPTVDESDKVPDASTEEGEFKITVRKLEMPVRPRGVLAE
jgi:hypothetical protein